MYQWHILTIGHVSRNKFWGEDEKISYRTPVATCVVLQGEGANIVIDPSLPTVEMEEALFNGSGLHASDITHTFSTHFHYDHQVELKTFPNALCCMPRLDLECLRANFTRASGFWKDLTKDQLNRLLPAEEHLPEGIRMVPLPGHTEGLSGYLFDAPEGKIIAAGDAVMSQEFWSHCESYFSCWNMKKAIESITSLQGLVDIIIPGHGQAFLANAY